MAAPENRSAGDQDGPRRRLRVLVLIDFLSLTGGAERFALGLATHLPPDRFDVWMCSTRRHEPEAVALLEQAGVTHLNLARRARWDVVRFRSLLGLLRAERFDVLHAHMFGSNVWGVTFGRASGVPVVIAHEHNWSYSGDPLRVWLDRNVIARFASRYVAVSESNLRRMVEIERIPADKIVVLPTAYIPSEQSEPVDVRAELGLAAGAPVIATAANLRVEKALEVLIEAHATVVRTFPDAHLVIVGDGVCQPELEQLRRQLDLTSAVSFLGRRGDVDSILRDVDICAMSSDWEGMPLFALETMAAGKPMVATNVGGLPEIVTPDRTGLLVPPRDPGALAEALVSLLADPDRRRRLGEAGAAELGDRTIDRVAERFAALYEQLLASAGGAPALAPRRARAPARVGRRRPDVLVLCYHACSPTWESALSVSPEDLRWQIGHLLERGWVPTTFSEAVLEPRSRRTLAITFDDGFASVRRHALPVLEQLGVPATLFVPTAFPDSGGPLSWPGIEQWLDGPWARELESLSWNGIRELAASGWEIGSHSHSHPRLTLLPDAELGRELSESRRILTAELGEPCRAIAYPYGATDARVAAAAADAGYLAGGTLARSLEFSGPTRQPRVGIYQHDGQLKFLLKVARSTRRLRASPLLFAAPHSAQDSAT
jgi:glycosyltransferase involved in cell wall biosynthesis/peptidoglycan/xylan/chitin deacetylase (PgdA/CDA1 family)